MAEGRARDLDLSVDAVAIVTSHLQATEAGQAARDLEDHALEARDPQLGARGSPPLSPSTPLPSAPPPRWQPWENPQWVGGWDSALGLHVTSGLQSLPPAPRPSSRKMKLILQ